MEERHQSACQIDIHVNIEDSPPVLPNHAQASEMSEEGLRRCYIPTPKLRYYLMRSLKVARWAVARCISMHQDPNRSGIDSTHEPALECLQPLVSTTLPTWHGGLTQGNEYM